MINKQFNLAKRPNGMPEDDCWELQENEIPDLLENQQKLKTHVIKTIKEKTITIILKLMELQST